MRPRPSHQLPCRHNLHRTEPRLSLHPSLSRKPQASAQPARDRATPLLPSLSPRFSGNWLSRKRMGQGSPLHTSGREEHRRPLQYPQRSCFSVTYAWPYTATAGATNGTGRRSSSAAADTTHCAPPGEQRLEHVDGEASGAVAGLHGKRVGLGGMVSSTTQRAEAIYPFTTVCEWPIDFPCAHQVFVIISLSTMSHLVICQG